jgi:hypothetical protein
MDPIANEDPSCNHANAVIIHKASNTCKCPAHKNSLHSPQIESRKYTATIPTHMHNNRDNRDAYPSPLMIPTAKIRIEATKEAAKKRHDEIQAHLDTTTMAIYTDGSGIESKLGAAVYSTMTNEADHQYLGMKRNSSTPRNSQLYTQQPIYCGIMSNIGSAVYIVIAKQQ